VSDADAAGASGEVDETLEGRLRRLEEIMTKLEADEVALEDALSLGLRYGSDTISTEFNDNTFSVGSTTTGVANNVLGSLFDTSVLDAAFDLNLVLQALKRDSAVNILSEPKIFTSDNQEAVFFDGQDVPIVTDTQLTETGTFNTTREYRAGGIRLSARPRITARKVVHAGAFADLHGSHYGPVQRRRYDVGFQCRA